MYKGFYNDKCRLSREDCNANIMALGSQQANVRFGGILGDWTLIQSLVIDGRFKLFSMELNMRMYIKSVIVDDQDKAREFYTKILGFEIKHNIPMGEHAWITVVSPEEKDGVELALEPNAHPASQAIQKALMTDGIPWTAFAVDDLNKECARLEAEGVVFTMPPKDMGDFQMAVFNDTCGNLIQLIQQ
jgi:predicted enzyme related to lactoylglutathione lyase